MPLSITATERLTAEYACLPIVFDVRSVLDVARGPEPDTFTLTERRIEPSYRKDYDASAGEEPGVWSQQFDTSNWVFFIARLDDEPVGAAAVAHATPALHMLEGRDDLAVLWDIRVLPSARRSGVGSALLKEAQMWARAKGCTTMKVETQNINTAACRFYARHGFVLRSANSDVYPDSPAEVQLLWYKDLQTTRSADA